MDMDMDIHAKICGYGYWYGWDISYPRQPCIDMTQVKEKYTDTFCIKQDHAYVKIM